MLINNNILNCQTRRRFNSFRGSKGSENTNRTVKYKHYEEMSDDVLKARSIIKAHNDVQKSAKMRLFKAVPNITAAALGTTIALAQPGKLAAKAGAGLGFLVIAGALSKVADKVVDKYTENKIENKKSGENNKSNLLKTALKIGAGIGVATLALMGVKSTKAYKTTSKFVAKELNQLAEEINNSKIGKFVEEKISPFTQKHASKLNFVPFGVVGASLLAQLGLADSLSNDMKEKTIFNYQKGKAIQKFAREHFDSIEAQEI